MANIFAKSGRENSVFYVGKVLLGKEFVDTGLTKAEFKANKVLADALDKGVILVGLPADEPEDDVVDTDTDESNDDVSDDDGLPDSKEELQVVAESYGIEFNPQLGAKKLKALIVAHLDAENE